MLYQIVLSIISIAFSYSGCLLLGGFFIFLLMSKAGQKLLEHQQKMEEMEGMEGTEKMEGAGEKTEQV